MNTQFLIEMAWKSAMVSAGVWLLLQSARGHSPAQRARLVLVGLAFLAALPILSLLLPPLEMSVGTVASATPPDMLASIATPQASAAVVTVSPPRPVPPPVLTPDQMIALVWIAGLATILLRLAGGLLTLRRWSAAAREVRCPAWTGALHRAGASHVRLLVSADASAPMSWGWREPTILLSPDVAADVSNADAVIAHEIAHFRRGDWARLLFARVVVALFWFNPLVWLLESALLHETEQAADAEAVMTIQPARYAETLLKIARPSQGFAAVANSMAVGPLGRRILRVLHAQRTQQAARWKAIATLAAFGLATPVAALSIVPAVKAAAPRAVAAPQAHFAPMAPTAPATVVNVSPAVAPRAARIASIVTPAVRAVPIVSIDTRNVARIAPLAPLAARIAAVVALAPVASDEDREIDAASRDLARSAERLTRSVERTMQRAGQAMAKSADSMEIGADSMLRGAESMRQEAVRLHDPAYRQRKIAEEAARGQHVTDRELIEAIPQMEKGADEMVRGAGEMRRGAAEMRRAASEHR